MIVRRLRELAAAVLAANFTTTSNAATSTLLTFAILPGEVWIVDVQMTTQCSSTGGVKYAVAAPSGATIEGWIYASTSAITTPLYQRLTAIGTLMTTAAHTVATTPGGDVLSFVVTAGANGGAVTIQAASGTSGQTTTIFAGSSLRAQRAA